MTPAPFTYYRPTSVADAISLLTEHGDEAKLIAGGHSLLPIMKLRFAAPEVLIDLGGIDDLDHIRVEGDEIAIGALARHVDLELSDLLRAEAPLLAHTAGVVGDCQIRHRGTFGGSVAHGDPSADLPASLMALRGTIVVEGPGGRRSIAVDDFYTGFLETALEPDELVVELRVPRVGDAPWGYQKFRRRGIDWAIVGVAYQSEPGAGGIGLVNMGPTTLRASASEAALRSGASHDEVAALAAEGTSPVGDGAGSSEYRRHLARVLLSRALAGRSTT
ncbi:xanthine dehydrogenase family protein subunit M [Pseudonocardia kujensis]|uniref:FAD binding domain-containing protein n=1 Tax=Pseudonocardia kujensis TaxID=1128675 RepID=UPI001E589E89|nr:xanthine dehydrogenase family protein subunit M [Pseudonocardia kujensis]MCE0767801.1 xanthine dehydrogenase family protein subunit M [Pseudonocardia kujensis]